MFCRVTLVAAAELLEMHSQATFNQMMVRLELELDIPMNTAMSVGKKCAELARIVVGQPDTPLDTPEGRMTLGEATVREAMEIASLDYGGELRKKFTRSLMRDGFSLTWDEDGKPDLRPALPIELGAKTDDEVHRLLKENDFTTPCGHLDQALNAHVRGDWAATNAQLRAFMESLLDEIAYLLRPAESQNVTSENRRALLGRIGFLSKERKEWSDDGKNYVNGLFKMLHTEGSHGGLSNENHSTLRLHLVLATARSFLRRLPYEN